MSAVFDKRMPAVVFIEEESGVSGIWWFEQPRFLSARPRLWAPVYSISLGPKNSSSKPPLWGLPHLTVSGGRSGLHRRCSL